ncbi:hypothetical protein CH35J_004416 [Colletotrichum higginsianum]|nr:hypothetical protein CH35J_004416 [Colletotrichum higginsianum]
MSGTDNRRRQQYEEEGVEEINPQSRGDAVDKPPAMSTVVSAIKSAKHQLAGNENDMKLGYSNMKFGTMRTDRMVEQATRDYNTFGQKFALVDNLRYYRNQGGERRDHLIAMEELEEPDATRRPTRSLRTVVDPGIPDPKARDPTGSRRMIEPAMVGRGVDAEVTEIAETAAKARDPTGSRRMIEPAMSRAPSNAASNSGAVMVGSIDNYAVKMTKAGAKGRHYDFTNRRTVPPWHGIVRMTRAYQKKLQIKFGPVFEDRHVRFNAKNTCAKCGHIGHWLSDCAFPDDSGFLYGCPIHNSRSHSFDDCPDFHRLSESQVLWLLVVLRGNKAPIRTTVSWSEYLRIAIEEGKWTSYNVPLPLTSAFVLDLVLGPKARHSWLDFDYATHGNDWLPSDPATRGPHAEVVRNTALDKEVHVPLTRGSLKKGRVGAAVGSDAPSYADDGYAPQEDNNQEEDSRETPEAEAGGDVEMMNDPRVEGGNPFVPEVDKPDAFVHNMVTMGHADDASNDSRVQDMSEADICIF